MVTPRIALAKLFSAASTNGESMRDQRDNIGLKSSTKVQPQPTPAENVRNPETFGYHMPHQLWVHLKTFPRS